MTYDEIRALPVEERPQALMVKAARRHLVPAVQRQLGMTIEVRATRMSLTGMRVMRTDGPETEELHALMDAYALGYQACLEAHKEFGEAAQKADELQGERQAVGR